MKILHYHFPDTTKNNFLLSLHKQFQEKGDLSQKQKNSLESMADEVQQCFLLHENFPSLKYDALNKRELESLEEDFDALKQKIIKNRFQKIEKRNECIFAFETIIKGEPCYYTIDNVLRPVFNYNRRYY